MADLQYFTFTHVACFQHQKFFDMLNIRNFSLSRIGFKGLKNSNLKGLTASRPTSD